MKQTLHLHCREFVSSETVFSSATNGGHKLIIPHHATQGFIALHLSGHSNFKVSSISHFSIIVTSVSSIKKLNGKASSGAQTDYVQKLFQTYRKEELKSYQIKSIKILSIALKKVLILFASY